MYTRTSLLCSSDWLRIERVGEWVCGGAGFCERFFWFANASACTSFACVTNIWYVPYIFDQRSQLCRDSKIKRKRGEKKPSSAYGKAGLICVDKLEATKVVITGVYTPISNRDKQWSPLLAFKVCLQPVSARRFHPRARPPFCLLGSQIYYRVFQNTFVPVLWEHLTTQPHEPQALSVITGNLLPHYRSHYVASYKTY